MPRSSSRYRSGLERDFAQGVTGWEFKFEPFMLPYVVHREYKPDFVHSDSGIIVECKGFFRTGDTQKYKAIRDSINKYNELIFILSDPRKKVRKGSDITMGKWCEKEGFRYFTLSQLDEFLAYVDNASKKKRKKSARL